jgi:DNA-binding transcriptional regulator LsrR (DeoR family)
MSPIIDAEDHLAHYGTPRKSGRYPWGSGSSETKRNREFLDSVENLRKQGMTDTEIARGFGMTTTQFRAKRTIARNEKNLHLIQQAQRLKETGMSNSAIGREMGLNESRIRDLLKPGAERKANILTQTADMLKRQVDEKEVFGCGFWCRARSSNRRWREYWNKSRKT